MNGYLLRKGARSEQQLLNELPKLLAAREFASKRSAELLRELALVYASPPPDAAGAASGTAAAVVKDLTALLAGLKDRKDDLRLARLVLCLLARLAERGAPEPALLALAQALEANELGPASAARQCAALRLHALLCAALGRRDALVARSVRPALGAAALAPVWAVGAAAAAGDRKQLASALGKKELPAQLAQLAAALHALRFHAAAADGDALLDSVAQAALLPLSCSAAPRHAAAVLLAAFRRSPPAAARVVKALHAALVDRKLRLPVVNAMDPLAAAYLLRLAGGVARLDVDSEFVAAAPQPPPPVAASANLLDFSFDAAPAAAAPAPPPPLPTRRLEGVTVSRALADRLRAWVLEAAAAAATGAAADGAAASPAARAVALTALEEAIDGADGSETCADTAAAALLRLLRDPRALGHAPLLHRLCRAAQAAAERLDLAAPNDRWTPVAAALRALEAHANAFVACAALRATVWLLPRAAADDWSDLTARLAALPAARIAPEARRSLADALVQRATHVKGRPQVDAALLAHALRVALAWAAARPCAWHAAALERGWNAALRLGERHPLGDAVFSGLDAVLRAHCCSAKEQRAAALALVQQSALVFVARAAAQRAAQQPQRWGEPLMAQCARHLLLAPPVGRRLAVDALAQLRREARRAGATELADRVTALFQYLQPAMEPAAEPTAADASPASPQAANCVVTSQIRSTRARQTLGVGDLLLAEMHGRSEQRQPRGAGHVAPAVAAGSAGFDALF